MSQLWLLACGRRAERSATGLRPVKVRSWMVGFGVAGQALTDLLRLLEVRT